MKPEAYKGIYPDTSPEILSWRSATGNDYRDEVWEGVYHVVPEKSPKQIRLEEELEGWLLTNWIAKTCGRLFRDTKVSKRSDWESDFRVPAFSLFLDFPAGAYEDHRLVASPDVVIEFASDERVSLTKINFYCQMGVQEVWVVDVFSGICEIVGSDNGKMIPTVDNAIGPVTSPVTGISIKTDKDIPGYSMFGASSSTGSDNFPFPRKPR